MSYAVNGVDLALQPEKHKWIPLVSLGDDGTNRPVYPSAREMELYWGMMSMAEWDEILGFWEVTQTTGSLTTRLPEWGTPAYQFKDYSGTTWDHPEYGDYFEEYVQQVKVRVRNIVT